MYRTITCLLVWQHNMVTPEESTISVLFVIARSAMHRSAASPSASGSVLTQRISCPKEQTAVSLFNLRFLEPLDEAEGRMLM